MEYNGKEVLSAWKKFVNENILDATHLRPEIARSWLRCKEYGLDPWSSNFDKADEITLAARRKRYHKLMKAAEPVLQYLVTLFNCNASLADSEGFVFELLTPLSVYSRTLGTYVLERCTGDGNLPLALIEQKPMRVDGFEHYRAVSQNYSGVSAPVEMPDMRYFLNINDPFLSLPPEALDICVAAGRLWKELYLADRQTLFSHLASATFFDPILRIAQLAVIVVDQDGMILTANEAGKLVVSGYESYHYAGQSLAEYLKDRSVLCTLLNTSQSAEGPIEVSFKGNRRRKRLDLHLLRSRTIQLQNGISHHLLIFDLPDDAPQTAEPPVLGRHQDTSADYVGASPAWRNVDSIVRKIAGHKSNVLILGATGTGKEVVARAIHRLSGRKGEFVPINCGAIPRDLLSSELFGYEGGAFTGARISGAVGKFEYANGGTLFLDEIGEMPVDMQVTLLRVLQEQTITRIGSNKPIRFDARIVAATNQDIEQLIQEKKFRSDLRYRLSVIEIQLPLLRERGEDVILLAQYFNELLGASLSIPTAPLSPEVQQLLSRYSWPGNVRELKNVMEKALIMAGGKPLTVEAFPAHIQSCAGAQPLPVAEAVLEESGLTPKQQREQREKKLITTLIEKHRGNLTRVAKDMGVSRNTLYRKIYKLGIQIKVLADDGQ